jgi:hypothetical protein
MRIGLLAKTLDHHAWFITVAQLAAAQLIVLHDLAELDGGVFDLLFWQTAEFEQDIYDAICSRERPVLWFLPREESPGAWFGRPRTEPLTPILTESDPEEVVVILKHMLTR